MNPTHPRVAVIGAGISGLTAGKMLKDYGVRYTTFETSDRIGGNWAFGNPNGHSSAYRSLHIDTSKDRLSFKDYPMPAHYPSFPHHSEVKAYLDDYADVFGLLDHIEFGNGVVDAARAEDGGWLIRDQAGAERRFNLLVVGNGHHWDPRLPDFPGAFAGDSIHSHAYIDPTTPLELTGKRILVVGIGNSAADITVELSLEGIAQRRDPVDQIVSVDRAEIHRGQAGRHVVPNVAVSTTVVAAQGCSIHRADAGHRSDDVRAAPG